ncbi:DUF3164 family protein [Rhodoplanes sp. TEM]|uniref:DUF3164 family protein n=1 Tax=Rhodoplanes tepidamans TaxID=200616 RepID=A0ABT5JES9_RHOTP|nr:MULTISPECIES: DUF3164 family protein [Rhodoplanes]MDC7788003.1 DUF3164 family protein [Rhodoplanes tepidamans]MDC7984843.1 DUF3164 family protein [Rhodoplanes sp. TEM]MDQ0358432.1 hypothetical protein [Rhodoplanes tepidamans]
MQVLAPDGTPVDTGAYAASTPPAPPAPAPDTGVITVGPHRYMRDAAGRLVPVETVRPEHLLEDQMVRKIVGYAEDLSAQIARFRGHTFDDVASFAELISERWGVKCGGSRGNVTFTSYDGCLKVQVQVQDQIGFGPELQVAKTLVDACITAWSADSRPEIRALVEHAFQVDQEGRINRAALFQLRRLQIDDAGWIRAMEAIGAAIRVIGSKQYVRFYKRATPRDAWVPITIDLASA